MATLTQKRKISEFTGVAAVVLCSLALGKYVELYPTFQSLNEGVFIDFMKDLTEGNMTLSKVDLFLSSYALPLIMNVMNALLLLAYASIFGFLMDFVLFFRWKNILRLDEKVLLAPFKEEVFFLLRLYISALCIEFSSMFYYVSMWLYLAVTMVYIGFLHYKSSLLNHLKKTMVWTRLIILPAAVLFLLICVQGENENVAVFASIILLFVLIIEFAIVLFTLAAAALHSNFKSAQIGKEKIRHIFADQPDDYWLKKSELAKFIQQRNKANFRTAFYLLTILLLSIYLYFFFHVLYGGHKFDFVNQLVEFMFIFTFFVTLRFASRSYEIIKAFITDISDKGGKKTSLDGKDRLILAIRSLVEIAVLTAVIRTSYMLVHEKAHVHNLLEPLSFGTMVIHQLFHGIAAMAFNVSYSADDSLLLQFIHIVQLLVSLSLITLSIASYLSYKGTNK